MNTTNTTIVKSTRVPRKSPKRNFSGVTSHLRKSPRDHRVDQGHHQVGDERADDLAERAADDDGDREIDDVLLMNSLNSSSTLMARDGTRSVLRQTGKLRKCGVVFGGQDERISARPGRRRARFRRLLLLEGVPAPAREAGGGGGRGRAAQGGAREEEEAPPRGDARRPKRGTGHAESPPTEAEPEPIELSAADSSW